jgi:hypothetical protein
MMPLSYYQIRDRADTIANMGLASLLSSLIPEIQFSRSGTPIRLHLIGHSFGGRMLVRSLERMQEQDKLVAFLQAAGTVNVVLANAALSPDRFDWISKAIAVAKSHGVPGRFTDETASYLFNVHSLNDTANRVLFRLASVFNDDPATCAAGACGVPEFPTVCVDDSGKLQFGGNITRPQFGGDLNAWNVNATRIVFDHSDIYKGRVRERRNAREQRRRSIRERRRVAQHAIASFDSPAPSVTSMRYLGACEAGSAFTSAIGAFRPRSLRISSVHFDSIASDRTFSTLMLLIE